MNPPLDPASLKGISHDDKWKSLEPILRDLYQRHTVKEIAKQMKDAYGFEANEAAYRYRFKAWGCVKNIPAKVQKSLISHIQDRQALGKRTRAELGDTQIPAGKIARWMRDNAHSRRHVVGPESSAFRQPGVVNLTIPNDQVIFLNWTNPWVLHSMKKTNGVRSPSAPSPLKSFPVEIKTPSEYGPSPQSGRTAAEQGTSPGSMQLSHENALERMSLFLEGRYIDLVRKMSDEEGRRASIWLHEFWLFAFTRAQAWGNDTTSGLDEAFQHLFHYNSPLVPSPGATASPRWAIDSTSALHDIVPPPTELCNWSIHYSESIQYEPLPYVAPNPEVETPRDFVAGLQDALQSNSFSSIPVEEVPLQLSHMSGAIQNSSAVLHRESMCFAIMAGNLELLDQLLENNNAVTPVDYGSMFPLHIATSYLNGASTCCNILDYLCQRLSRLTAIYTNEHGHTVLDNLFLTILRCHAREIPQVFGQSLQRENRFMGAEVDICGRWDAKSPQIRRLFATGNGKIPFHWKHKFCHTAVQAVCHCIQTLEYAGILSMTESGLFSQDCLKCGERFRLLPLHALTLATFFLGQSGTADEDLFGMIAVLLKLLSLGLSSASTATISLQSILGQGTSDHCVHNAMTPFELSQEISELASNGWNPGAITGWRIFCQVLRLAERTPDDQSLLDDDSTDDEPDEGSVHSGNPPYPAKCCAEFPCINESTGALICSFSHSAQLGHVWAAVQTELLTYRRLAVGGAWLSPNFDLTKLYESLQTGEPVSMPLVDEGRMMNPYCACGNFGTQDDPRREDTSKYYFSNLDVWERTSFIELPSRLN